MIEHTFNKKVNNSETVGEFISKPLIASGITQSIVDVGARSGMFELPESFTSGVDFIGFEPNPIEYKKLIEGKTDSILAGGKQPAFKTKRYFPTAVWSDDSERRLNITIGAGACSLCGEADIGITSKMYLEGREKYSYYESVQKIVSSEIVTCSPLDSLFSIDDVIDYLKVDVEGGELDVFKGAENLLSNHSVLFIKTEFLTTPYYRNRVLFGHQHVYLEEMGYRLIDIDLSHLRYLREPTKISKLIDRRPIYAGDAFFMLDPDLVAMDDLKRHRLAIMLLVFGFNSLAISLFKEAGVLSKSELTTLESTLSQIPLYKILKEHWVNLPYKVWPILKAIRLYRPS